MSLIDEMTDAELAMALRKTVAILKEDTKNRKPFFELCGLCMVADVAQVNATEGTLRLGGVTLGERDLGAWEIVVKKAPEKVTGQEEFVCGYCMEVVWATDYPDTCPHCKVGYCQSCQTRVKVGQRWCHGCGKITPEIKSRFVRASSISSAYQEQHWMREGLPEGQAYSFGLAQGWQPDEDHATVAPRAWLFKDDFSGQGVARKDIRILDEAETTAVGIRFYTAESWHALQQERKAKK